MNTKIPQELLEQAKHWPDLKGWQRRELAQSLRRLGFSLPEISKFIPASRGTLTRWCRDIELSPEEEERLLLCDKRQLGRIRAGAKLRQRYLKHVDEVRAAARAEAHTLSGDAFWLGGLVAYLAEGTKRTDRVEFINSDPSLVNLFIAWAMTFLDVSSSRFTVALHLHDGQDEGERRAYWSAITRLPHDQFVKTIFKPEGSGHRKNKLYNGMAQVRVRQSADLLQRVMGWVEWLQETYLSSLDSLWAASEIGIAGDS